MKYFFLSNALFIYYICYYGFFVFDFFLRERKIKLFICAFSNKSFFFFLQISTLMILHRLMLFKKCHYLNTFHVYSFTLWISKRGLKYSTQDYYNKTVHRLHIHLSYLCYDSIFTAYVRILKTNHGLNIMYLFYSRANIAILHRCFISVKMFYRFSIGKEKYMFLMNSSPPNSYSF